MRYSNLLDGSNLTSVANDFVLLNDDEYDSFETLFWKLTLKTSLWISDFTIAYMETLRGFTYCSHVFWISFLDNIVDNFI